MYVRTYCIVLFCTVKLCEAIVQTLYMELLTQVSVLLIASECHSCERLKR